MTEFEFLAIGISLILGLGVTMLLTSLLSVFQARRRIRMDWIPLVWAFYILLIQAQFYSATWSLTTRTEWSRITFIAPMMVAGLIFLAAGLVLPNVQTGHHDDLGQYFDQDGKWAVLALAARGCVAIFANVFVMRALPSLTPVDMMILAQIAMALLFFFARTRRFRVVATILYGLMFLITLFIIYS